MGWVPLGGSGSCDSISPSVLFLSSLQWQYSELFSHFHVQLTVIVMFFITNLSKQKNKLGSDPISTESRILMLGVIIFSVDNSTLYNIVIKFPPGGGTIIHGFNRHRGALYWFQWHCSAFRVLIGKIFWCMYKSWACSWFFLLILYLD